MKKLILAVLLSGLFVSCEESTTDPGTETGPDMQLVRTIVNSVNLDSLLRTVNELTGETMAPVGGNLQHIYTRKSGTNGNLLAAQYLLERLQGYGIPAQYYAPPGRLVNVIGTLTGTADPDRRIIICAHFDNTAVTDTIYGADDNASGSAAVIEAARLLSRYRADATIIFALFNEEEQGLLGSKAYASTFAVPERSNTEVVNLDMIAWDSNDNNVVEIHSWPVAGSSSIADTLGYLNTAATIGLTTVKYDSGTGGSDHRSFWEQGRSAVLLIEETRTRGDDFNAYYHTIDDRVVHFNLDFFHSCARLGIGGVAMLARVRPE